MKLRYLFFFGALLVLALAMALRHHPYFQKPVSFLEVPLLAIEPKEVQTISIQKGQEELLITKELDRWLSTNGQWSNTLNQERVEALLESLRSIVSTGIVGQNAADWPSFNQTPPNVHFIRLYDKYELLGSFYLSISNPVDTTLSNTTFFRLPNTNLVYEVPSEIGLLWLQPLDLYRERQLLSFDPLAVRSIEVETPQMPSLLLFRSDSTWQDSTGQSWPDDLLEPWLHRISNLQGQSYAERFNEVEKQDLPTTRYAFSIENQGQVIIEVFADSNQVDYPFVIRSNQFPDRYFKSDSAGLYQQLKLSIDGRFNSGL